MQRLLETFFREFLVESPEKFQMKFLDHLMYEFMKKAQEDFFQETTGGIS